MANKTWDLVELLEGKEALPCKWVCKVRVIKHGTCLNCLKEKKTLPCKWFYKKKCAVDDPAHKYKACLVAKAFKQQKGIDFNKFFSSSIKIKILCTDYSAWIIDN